MRMWQYMRQHWLPTAGHLSSLYARKLDELKGREHNCICEAARNTYYNSLKNDYHQSIGFGFELIFSICRQVAANACLK